MRREGFWSGQDLRRHGVRRRKTSRRVCPFLGGHGVLGINEIEISVVAGIVGEEGFVCVIDDNSGAVREIIKTSYLFVYGFATDVLTSGEGIRVRG